MVAWRSIILEPQSITPTASMSVGAPVAIVSHAPGAKRSAPLSVPPPPN
jgi:hypothetical protein